MEIKGKHFRVEVPKALKNMEHQKSSASASSGGSAPFVAGTKAQWAKPESALRHQGSAWSTSKAVLECRRTFRADGSSQQGKALKSQHPVERRERILFLISVFHGPCTTVLWVSRGPPVKLSCHLAVISWPLHQVASSCPGQWFPLFLCLARFSPCLSQKYFHPSHFCLTSDRGRSDLTPLYFLWTPTGHLTPETRQPLWPDRERIHRDAHQHPSRRTGLCSVRKQRERHHLRNTSQKKPHKRVSHP